MICLPVLGDVFLILACRYDIPNEHATDHPTDSPATDVGTWNRTNHATGQRLDRAAVCAWAVGG